MVVFTIRLNLFQELQKLVMNDDRCLYIMVFVSLVTERCSTFNARSFKLFHTYVKVTILIEFGRWKGGGIDGLRRFSTSINRVMRLCRLQLIHILNLWYRINSSSDFYATEPIFDDKSHNVNRLHLKHIFSEARQRCVHVFIASQFICLFRQRMLKTILSQVSERVLTSLLKITALWIW